MAWSSVNRHEFYDPARGAAASTFPPQGTDGAGAATGAATDCSSRGDDASVLDGCWLESSWVPVAVLLLAIAISALGVAMAYGVTRLKDRADEAQIRAEQEADRATDGVLQRAESGRGMRQLREAEAVAAAAAEEVQPRGTSSRP